MTSEEMEKKINEYRRNELKDNETFKFECKENCGMCCYRPGNPVLINGVDVYYAAKALGMSAMSFMRTYCVPPYLGESSKLPCITLDIRRDGFCKLLNEKKQCSIHTSKPTVCALFPLGRMYENNIKNSEDSRYIYFTQPDMNLDCVVNATKSQTLKEWKDAFSIEKRDCETAAWNSLLERLIEERSILEKLCEYDKSDDDDKDKALAATALEACFVRAFVAMYVYNPAKPLLPQIKLLQETVEEELSELRADFEDLQLAVAKAN